MGIKNRRVTMLNFKEYAESIPNKVYLNEVLLSEPNKDILDVLFHQTESSLEFAPHCECEAYKGPRYEGSVCPLCGTVVSSEFVSNFTQHNWVRIPENMPAILHPIFYFILKGWSGKLRMGAQGSKNAGKRQKIAIIDYILDPEEDLPDDLKPYVEKQGFTFFMDHFDEIMHSLLYEHPKLSINKKTKAIAEVYETYRDCLVIREFPILHHSFHPMHSSKKTKYVDKTADPVLSLVMDLANTVFSKRNTVTKSNYIDKQMWSIYSRYTQYIKSTIEEKIGDKYALVRRHAIAARLHFSGRGVISPLIDRHRGDEVHLPWDIGLNGLKLEIINILIHRKSYTPTDAVAKVMKAFSMFDPEIYEIIQTLIDECPYKGLPLLFGRNPNTRLGRDIHG